MTKRETIAGAAVQLRWALSHARDLEAECATAKKMLAAARDAWTEIGPLDGCPVGGCGNVDSCFAHEGDLYGKCSSHHAAFPITREKYKEWKEAAKQSAEAKRVQRTTESVWPF